METSELDLTVRPDEFTMDEQPTKVEIRYFDGKDATLPKVEFEHPDTGIVTPESSATVTTFAFNGTALLTPAAFDHRCAHLTVDQVDRRKLRGPLLTLPLEQGVAYGPQEIDELLRSQGIDPEQCASEPEKFIVLFCTGLMKKVLGCADPRGMLDYKKLDRTQENRSGITEEGARRLSGLRVARAFMVDNVSFEVPGQRGFHATQLLAAPDPRAKIFTPLVYHVSGTHRRDFIESVQGRNARIEVGNQPRFLPGCSVAVFVE